MDRKAFLAAISVPILGCTRAAKPPEGKTETEPMLFTLDDLNDLLDVYQGVWWKETEPIKTLKLRDHLWRKTLTFTDPENQERFKDAYLDDFLESMPLIAYKYFIKDSDLDPEDIPKLKEMVKRSIR